VALDGQPRVLRLHPLAIVFDPHQPLAAQLDADGDAPRARVNRVLDQLLDHGRRPLDDFAGGDLVGEIGRQSVDAGHLDYGLFIKSSGAFGSRTASPRRRRP
jgi:hypothetical protein